MLVRQGGAKTKARRTPRSRGGTETLSRGLGESETQRGSERTERKSGNGCEG